MIKIIVLTFFLNLFYVQNTFAQVEKTIFGFSLEFPSSKYVVLKEQNEATIKEFFRQNGYRDKPKRVLPGSGVGTNKSTQPTINDLLEQLYETTKDDNGKRGLEVVIYMGGVLEKDFPMEVLIINYITQYKTIDEFRDRKSLEELCNTVYDGKNTLKYCEFENIKTKKQTIEIIKSKSNVTTPQSKKVESIQYFVNHNNGIIHFAFNCHVSCKKIDGSFVSIISSIK